MMSRKRRFLTIGSVIVPLFALLLVGAVWAVPPGASVTANEVWAKPTVVGDTAHFNGNTIDCIMTNDGSLVDHRPTGSSGMEWPKGSDKTIDYHSGLWLAGIGHDDGHIYTACNEYASELLPGLVGADPRAPEFRFYKLNKEDVENRTGDYSVWPFDQGAPFETDSLGNPILDEDGNKIPKVIGDQTLFFVCNDSDVVQHSNVFSTSPMGVEFRITVFGFNRSDPMGNIMFVKWEFIHKGTQQFDSCFVAQWDDPDLGDASDDLVGCDTTLGLGYCYNGSPTDGTYGSTPPAIGFDFFQGPKVPDPGNPGEFIFLPMTAFAWYWNGAPDPFDDPEIPSEAFWFMNGYAGDGTPYRDKYDNVTSPFPLSGDPVTGTGDIDGDVESPGDRRFLMASGPFTLAPGDTQVVLGAKIIAPGADNLKAIMALRYFDIFAQLAYDENFKLPSPPSPRVDVSSENQQIVLSWDQGHENLESYSYKGYMFEGYNVYQGPSANGPWTRIVTFDRKSNYDEGEPPIDLIFDLALDPETGMVLDKPVQFGSESGLQRHIYIDKDILTQTSLSNYRRYYFTVTAYAFNPDSAAAPRTVESAQKAITIFPQERFEANPSIGDTLEVTHTILVGNLPSDGEVVPLVMDSYLLNDHEYEVTFYEVEVDEEVETRWKLTDKTRGVDVLTDKTYQGGHSEYYDFVDAMLVKVLGPDLAVKDWEWDDWSLEEDDEDSTRWFTGVNWGGSALGGGLDVGWNFQGSTLSPGDYRKVEVRFSKNEADWSICKVYERPGYLVKPQTGTFPGSAWDVDSDPPRRLNICFLENVGSGIEDYRWDPNDVPSDGGREYLYIMNSDYNEAADYDDENSARNADVQYAWWPVLRDEHVFLQAEGTLTITPNYVNTPKDVFTFKATAPTGGSDVQKFNLAKINVVPNPYFAFNPQERIATTRFVTFTHLPFRDVTIRIFTLDGTLVKIINNEEREDQGTVDTPMAYWYLRNEGDVPVASGIYLAHIEIKGVGDKILKIAVFMPEERLDYF